MSNLKKNLVYIFIQSLSQVLFPLVSIPYISRILSPDGIGKVSFIDSLTYYFITFAEFGIVTYGIREIAKHRNEPAYLKKLASELVLLHIITSAVVLVVYGGIVTLLWHRIGDVRLLLFSLSFLLVSFFSCEWYFVGMERFRFVVVRNLVTRVLGLCSIFVLVRNEADYSVYYGIITCTAAAVLLWNIISLLKEVPLSFKGVEWKQHLQPAFIIFQVTILFSATLWLDNILLGFISGAVALGYYAFATKVIRISGQLLTDSMWVLFPRMVSLLKHGTAEHFANTNLQSIRLFTMLSVPLSAGLFILAEPFTLLYFGPAFGRVYIDIQILALFPFVKCYSMYLTKQMLQPFGHDKLVARGLFAGFIALVVFMAVLCPFLKDMGAAVSLILSEVTVALFFTWWLRKNYAHIRLFDFTALLQALAGSLFFIPIVYIVSRLGLPLLPHLLLTIAGCIIVYFVAQLFVFRNKLLLQVYRQVWQYVRNDIWKK